MLPIRMLLLELQRLPQFLLEFLALRRGSGSVSLTVSPHDFGDLGDEILSYVLGAKLYCISLFAAERP